MDQASKIAELNDLLRCHHIGGKVMITQGIQALAPDTIMEIVAAVATFSDFTPDNDPHDLRRTMVTMMNERLGIAPHVVEACVNHISGAAKAGVAGVYNKALYLAERRAAFEAWAKFVETLVMAEG